MLDELASEAARCPPQEGTEKRGSLFVRCLKVGSGGGQEVGKLNP